MTLVELFRSGVEDLHKDNPTALSLMNIKMQTFMLQLDIDTIRVNGPYVNHIPPEMEGLPERVVYTANIEYHIKK